jgi:hypothetical protein
MIAPVLVLLITVMLFGLVSVGLRVFKGIERSVTAMRRGTPPRDAKGRFCRFYGYSQMRRDNAIE